MGKSLWWARDINFHSGIALGYGVLQRALKSGLAQLDWELDDKDSPIAFHVCPPGGYKPIEGKRNVLFTMWESETLPDDWGPIDADLVIVPSRFCAEVLKPIAPHTTVVPLGLDTGRYHHVKRSRGKTFRWLWVGAPNARKGWDVIEEAWQVFHGRSGVELYLKSSGTVDESIRKFDNLIVDRRTVSDNELVSIYHSANGFLFPTAGEGWGLSLLEAMATGLPCITTRYSGLLDFCSDDNCYFVDHVMQEQSTDKGLVVRSAYVSSAHLALLMGKVMRNYDRALEIGQHAARTASRFSWMQTCRQVAQLLGS